MTLTCLRLTKPHPARSLPGKPSDCFYRDLHDPFCEAQNDQNHL